MKNKKTLKPVFATWKRKKWMKEKTIFLSVNFYHLIKGEKK
jgi:hypothetical protein